MEKNIKLIPLSPIFNSEKYIKENLKRVSEISGLTFWGLDGPTTAPVFDINKIYEQYYKQAKAGEITEEILKKHELDIFLHKLSFKPPDRPTMHLIDSGPRMKDLLPIGDYDLFNPLMPMVNQFAMCAALSNVYLKNDDKDQSFAFTIRAVEIYGSIERYISELIGTKYVLFTSEIPQIIKEAHDRKENSRKKGLGGAGKRKNANDLAKKYWGLCQAHEKYETYTKKYSKLTKKVSDSLYDLINPEQETDELKKIPYGRQWFYDNVIKPNNPVKIKSGHSVKK